MFCQKCVQTQVRAILSVDQKFHLKMTALAQMETASFCAGVYFVSSLGSGGAKNIVNSWN